MPRPKKYKTEAERRAVSRQRARIKRANETPLERDRRLMNLSLNEWNRRRNETIEERKERLKRLSLNARKRRAKETAEKANRLRKLSENEMKRRARESSQKRNKNTNKCTSKPNCHNTQVAKRPRGRKPTANGFKIALTNCYNEHENCYLEQIHQDPGKFEAPIEKSELNSIQSSQHSVETRKLQKVTVENDANLKQQTKATTRAQRNQLISVNTSNEVNSKLCKNNSEILLHPQSVVPPVQEKRILVVPNHQTAVMSNLFSMWKAGRLCDSYISNGTTTIMVHKMVLGAVCPKLLPILHHSSKGSFPKVTFPSSVSKEGLLAFAEYMYNGVVDLNEEILVQLKTIGERLSMKDFEQLCCNELNKAKTKDILSAVVEPLLAEPCSLSGLFPSRTQGDINKIQNSMLINLFRNNYSNSNNMQPGVLVSTGSSTSNVRSEEIMTTNQIIDIQSEVEPEIESATNHNSLQLKIEPYSPDENQHSFQEELYMDIGNTSSNNNHHLPPATSATSGNINTDNDLTVTYSDNQYKNDLNMVSSDNINISDAPQSEETCLSQHTENCDEDTDNQKELQLISITSVAGNINEDNLSNNSDLVETSSTMPTNTKQLQTSNSKPYPISLFSVNNGDYTAV
ncbi:uncharacterized protein LOC106872008 isoform X3 [Octopus bimaculoides]|uniref:BTB domain-containing protein n=1 Tax=Octopus bimaculoides TaxID=37653 RepID=A0A0L8H9E8_OCTBM|nr:uncharacterized protein LOC106872008 isoform X3 [Octopus bimaculoides]|eukprot:XP_014774302.1 PREDICTED: uncharacterized protein LOC106872008 isoform X3 [Octopus bimaculoides]